MVRRLPAAVLLAALALAATGCGSGAGEGDSRPDADTSILLQGPPSAIDAGVELAVERGYDEAEGVRLQVRTPVSPADAVPALLRGDAELAIVDVHDLALARQRGQDVVGVMGIVQTPLASVIAGPAIRRPRDLAGRRIGVTGDRGQAAALRALVRADGGNPARVRFVRVGTHGVRALLRHRVDAIAGDWTAEGVAARARDPRLRVLRIDAYGAPQYPEYVLAATRETVQTDGPVVRAVIRLVRRGYEEAIADPASALSALTDAAPGTAWSEASHELDAVSPSFTATSGRVGELDARQLRTWAAWERRAGIVRKPIDVAAAFAPDLSRTGEATDPNAGD